MAHYHKLDCLKMRLDYSVVVKVKGTIRSKLPVKVHLDDISSSPELFVTKRGTVMQHYGQKCHSRGLVCCLQVQGHSEGSFDQI